MLQLCEGYVLTPTGTVARPGHAETVGTCEVWIAVTDRPGSPPHAGSRSHVRVDGDAGGGRVGDRQRVESGGMGGGNATTGVNDERRATQIPPILSR